MWTQALMAGVWGGVLALERRAFLQAMVSRPVVAGVGAGLLLDSPLAGLSAGLFFELLHLGGASLGGVHAEHELLPTVAAVALADGVLRAGQVDSVPAAVTLAVLVAAPLGRLGLRLEHRLDERARRYYGRALSAADAGNLPRVARQNLRALWPQFLGVAVGCAGAVLAGPALAAAAAQLPGAVVRGLAWAWPALGAAVAGVAVQGTNSPRRLLLASLGAVAAAAPLLWGAAR